MVVSPPFLRTEFNYDMNAAGDESGLRCEDPSLAKQSFAEEVDINTIVRRFNVTGELPQAVRLPTYGDFTNVMDFKQAQNAIRAAEESFMAMPHEIRARFDNDPARFVDFCSDPENLPQAKKWGLAPPDTTPSLGVVVSNDTEQVSKPSKKEKKDATPSKDGSE